MLYAARQLLKPVAGPFKPVMLSPCCPVALLLTLLLLLLTLLLLLLLLLLTLLLLLLQALPAVCSCPRRTLTSGCGWARAAGAACLCSREAAQQTKQVGRTNWRGVRAQLGLLQGSMSLWKEAVSILFVLLCSAALAC
jgi:hypothetical protein